MPDEEEKREPLLPGGRSYDDADGEGLVEILRRYGFWAFTNKTHCICGRLEILSFKVNVSCHSGGFAKGYEGSSVRVYSDHMDARPEDLRAIAAEMVEQVQERNYGGAVLVSYSRYQENAVPDEVHEAPEQDEETP